MEKSVSKSKRVFEDNIYSSILTNKVKSVGTSEGKVKEFVNKLIKLLPKVGSDENKVIQIETLVALSIEGILTLDNLEEKASMIRAICEMIKVDPEKRDTAISLARRLLK